MNAFSPSGSQAGAYETLLTIVNGVDALILIIDLETYEVLFMNQAAQNAWGYVVGEKCWENLVNTRVVPCVDCPHDKLWLSTDKPRQDDYLWEYQHTLSGKWYSSRDRALRWRDGRWVKLSIATDITERKAMEEALRQREAKLMSITDNMLDMIGKADERGIYTYVSPSYQHALGYHQGSLLGESIFTYVHPEDLSFVKKQYEDAVQKQQPAKSEFRYRHANGSYIWVECVANILLNENNKFIGTVLGSRNITDRKLAERELQKSRDMLLESQRIGQIASWEWDLKNKKITWSDEFYRILGLVPQEVEASGSLFFKHVPQENIAVVKRMINDALHGKKYGAEHRYISADGKIGWLYSQGEAVINQKGKPVRMFGIVQEITQRKQAEQLLRDSEEKYRQLVELSPAAIIVEHEGKIILVNREALNILGISEADKAIGNATTNFFDQDCRALLAENIWQSLLKNAPFEQKLKRYDGLELTVELLATTFEHQEKTLTRILLWDLTEQKIKEEEFLKASKLESVGLLAGGIAHDFNNILTIITGYLSIARLYARGSNQVHQRLVEVEKATKQAISLTRQLLTFAKGGAPVRQRVCISEIIEDAVKFALSGSIVEWKLDLSRDLAAVEVDEGQFSQVINNIVINANQAMPEGGTVRIRGHNIHIEPNSILPLREGNYVEVSISDCGIGIARDDLPKIFDPYFTTKANGSGLGLASSYSIIKKHDGHMYATSELGKGTTFYIYLPATSKSVYKEYDQGKLHWGKGNILVMDDDKVIRTLVGEMLAILGYDYAVAHCGDDAVTLFRQAHERYKPFNAVVLDLTIRGGMGGKETLQKMLDIDPKVKAIVASGYSSDSLLSEYSQFGFKAIIAKPFRLEELSKVLHDVLESAPNDFSVITME